jgi:hypothetical protein
VTYNEELGEYKEECFKTRLLTPKDVEYFLEVDTYGSLELAKQRAEAAPDWELFQAWDVDPVIWKAEQERIECEHSAAHHLGISMISKPEYEFNDGEEFLSRFGFKREKIAFKPRRSKILSTKDQKLLADHFKKMEADKKRIASLERAVRK